MPEPSDESEQRARRFLWSTSADKLFTPVNPDAWWTESNGVRMTWRQYNDSQRYC